MRWCVLIEKMMNKEEVCLDGEMSAKLSEKSIPNSIVILVKLLEVLLEILCVPLNAIYVLPFIRIQIQRTFQIVYFLKSKSKNIFDVFVNRVNILQTLNVRNFDWFFLSYKLYLFIFSINRASVKTI